MTRKDLSLGSEAGELTLSERDGRLHVSVRPREGDAEWTSPLLDVEIMDRMQERVDRVTELRVMHLAEEEQGLHVVVRDEFRGVTVGLWLNWVDGELSVLLPPAEVEEACDVLYRVHSIMLLPELMGCGPDGKLLLPVNTGALCSPANKPPLADRFLVYGEQERWELVPMLPVSGVQTARGGLLCLARQGACDAWCAVETDGEGNGRVAMGAMFRRQWVDPVDWTQRELRFRPLAADEDLVHAAAERVRRHVLDDLRVPSLAERAAESPQCAYQQSAYTMKLFHGIQQQGIMMVGRENKADELLYKRVLTFRQAEAGLKKLKDAGVERAYLQSVGWNPRGHDGAWPTCFPIDHRLGGESGLRSMIETAKGLGYHITTHLNCASAFFRSPDFVPDRVIHDIWGKPKVVGYWGGGVKSTHWGLALPEGLLETRMEALKAMGFNGMQYLDGIGNPLYVNYHPSNGGPRRDHAAGINRYLDTARRIFGAVQTEMGFLYCIPHTDALVGPYYTPYRPWPLTRTDWPVVALIDRQVPLYQLALHDRVTQEQQGVAWRDVMNAVLFGKVMRDEWSAEPGVMPVLDEERIARIKAVYDVAVDRFGHLATQSLEQWRPLAEGVEETRFGDGTEVRADFNERRLWVNGREVNVPAALSGS